MRPSRHLDAKSTLRVVLVLLACLVAGVGVRPERALAAGSEAGQDAGAKAAEVGILDESGFGFKLRVPLAWSVEIDAEDGPMLSWRMHQNDWIGGGLPAGLLALSVTVIEPDAGKDLEKEFRGFVGTYSKRYFDNGRLRTFRPFTFGAFPGFTAELSGRVRDRAGPPADVIARVFVYATEDRQVIVSAVATRPGRELAGLGEPGSLIEATSRPPDQAAPDEAAAPAGANTRRTIMPDPDGSLEPVSWGGGSLAEYGRSDEAGLSIEIPPDGRTGGVGVLSRASPIRLGDLDRGAATILTAVFDPQRTDTALIILCPGRMVPCLSEPSFHLRLLPRDGGSELSLWAEDRQVAAERLPAVPERVTMRIDRDGVYAFPSNGDGLLAERSRALASYGALDVLVVSVPIEGGGRLALRALTVDSLDGTAGEALPEPEGTAFPTAEPDRWTALAMAGGDFAAFARLGPDGLRVSVPENRSWGITGLVSAKPSMAVADGSVSVLPHRLRVAVRPEGSEAFAVALLPAADADPWLGSLVHASFTRLPDGGYRVRLNACGSAARVAEATVAAGWAGMFDLLLHGDRVELALPGARISTPLIACLAPETGLHVAVFAVAAEEHRPTSLDLLSLAVDRGGGAPDPDDASALADAAFDPRSWLAATAAELSGTEP